MGELLGRWLTIGVMLSTLLGAFPQTAVAETVADPTALRATVAIGFWFEATDKYGTRQEVIAGGSGAIVSADGLVLTNHHVVHQDLDELEANLERNADYWGNPTTYTLLNSTPVISLPDGRGFVTPAYLAEVADESSSLDVTVLRITATSSGTPIDRDALALPFFTLGDSDDLEIGEVINVFGYPTLWGFALSMSRGIVSGFEVDWRNPTKFWIKTDAGISGGNSGGAALDGTGALIGIPTLAANLDCRPGDTNYDGQTDERDGCFPTGSSIGMLRPINDTKALIARARTAEPVGLETPTPAPVPTATLSSSANKKETSACGTPRLEPGEVVPLIEDSQLWSEPKEGSSKKAYLTAADGVVLIIEVIEVPGNCLWYRVDELPDGESGYLRQDVLQPKTIGDKPNLSVSTPQEDGPCAGSVTLETGDKARTNQFGANLWSLPLLSSKIVYQVPRDTKVTVIRRADLSDRCDWYLVRVDETGKMGYVKEEFIEPWS